MTVLFETPHGSHLYGLAHAESDRDVYRVLDVRPRVSSRARWSRQTIRGDDDVFEIDFGTWIGDCTKGVPQALEAMYSRDATVDAIAEFRAGFRVSSNVVPTYMRTIKSFLNEGSFKRRRHAFRLALNANSILKEGRFNPRLTAEQAEAVTLAAECDDADLSYNQCLHIIWS